MRIQHNIMAMNAYRNYTNNVNAMKKNLEKLSSGYKINRAGDDAAGLAISEKMRAQITGLQQAQSNAKSGINLVQTAEGALQEVHDMLNRMVKLADQSANGTYDDSVDRVQLQKEVTQLQDEINRIADSANFNGIKLLDGSMDGNDKVTVNAPSFSGLEGMNLRELGAGKPYTDDTIEIQTHQDAKPLTKTSFTMNMDNIDFKLGGAKEGEEVQGTLNIATAKTGTGENQRVVSLNFTVKAGKDGAITNKQIADAICKAITESNDDNKCELVLDFGGTNKTDSIGMEGGTGDDAAKKQVEYGVVNNGDGTLTFTMTDDGFETAKAEAIKEDGSNTYFAGGFNYTVYMDTADETKKQTVYQQVGMTNVTQGQVDETERPAQALLHLNDHPITDGSGFKVGDQHYVWGLTDETVNGKYGDNVKVIDIRDLAKADGTLDLGNDEQHYREGMTEALSRFTQVAKDNSMFSVELTKNGQQIVFTEKSTNTSDADLTTVEGMREQLQAFTGITADVETKAASGKALTLQIGDTSDAFNQLKVNIADMHVAALGLDKINIANQADAAKAVDIIKNAINTVSDIRGTLGATQNRLDHTINNLSVMTENIQDAESTIRDTDVADEMMAYTKNNILIQSAQAMLAQANQVPQGVLQLLG